MRQFQPAPGKNYPEPKEWFHDIFRVDGTPFDQGEVTFIKDIIGSQHNILEMTQFRDAHNRTFIPQGYVTNTHVGGVKIEYPLAEYQRMTRYGANFQVIRIGLARLGGWPIKYKR